jgi:agmatine deiminase
MSPAGFCMPAEWSRHDAVWTAWPYALDQWAEGVEAPQQSLMAMCAAIVDVHAGVPRGERVELLVRHGGDEAAARALLGPAAVGVRFHVMSYGDVWLRDTGPIFLARPGEIMATRYRFDGWGGKYLMPGDPEVAAQVTALAGTAVVSFDFVLEGGAVEVDGAGLVLTTKQCLLGGARNPGLGQDTLDARLRYCLGAEQVVWLDQGLANDHTDGHIDTIARFVAPGVVACMEPGPSDPNREALLDILAALRASRDARGHRLEVVTLPSPGAVLDATGNLLPASYMNFYIANTTVVVPTYGVSADDAAVAQVASWFPGRRVMAVPGKAVVVGGGAFHCSTQQQPSANE